jgi:hypothetical protein
MTRQCNGGSHGDRDDAEGCQSGEEQAASRRIGRDGGHIGHSSSSLIVDVRALKPSGGERLEFCEWQPQIRVTN